MIPFGAGSVAAGKEQPMNWSHWIRQSHRWLSIVFTLTVIANFVALAVGKGEQPPAVVTYSPLLPLFLLMFSGLYMFFLPYVARRRNARSSV
jgi:cellulose synthase/poly-beta-1,6-N-acetylglucosamine synthase-like glycosyltransferase